MGRVIFASLVSGRIPPAQIYLQKTLRHRGDKVSKANGCAARRRISILSATENMGLTTSVWIFGREADLLLH